MKGTQCLNNSRSALYRVFVSPLESSTALRSSFALASQPCRPRQNAPAPQAPRIAFNRGLSTSATRFAFPPRRQRVVPDRLPKDYEIRAKEVMLSEEDNQITGPHKTQRLLLTLDKTIYSLRTIEDALPPPKPTEDGKPQKQRRPGAQYPLCRIVHKVEEYKAKQAQAKAKKEANKVKQKAVEINWAIAQNDLALKLKQLKSFLEKGHKVTVTFARKKGARAATSEEMQEAVKAVKDAAAEVPGAKNWKAADGEVGRKYSMYFEGKVVATPPPPPAEASS
ncbi:translation initiation factor IF-3 [Plectosphaerella plurivora]|uniref:Translation initiation factor IF-3 n=1 Tax=Plectosphaerella plurivora TaxID=936078 RepID=A0A9P9A861_9PEZI|nr:translation initiation factor IF-3 [Plectosphaerella plurivora]